MLHAIANTLRKFAVTLLLKQFSLAFFFGSFMQISGQIAPLDEIVRLKEKYHFRLILEPFFWCAWNWRSWSCWALWSPGAFYLSSSFSERSCNNTHMHTMCTD